MIDQTQLDQLCINTIHTFSIDAVQKAQAAPTQVVEQHFGFESAHVVMAERAQITCNALKK